MDYLKLTVDKLLVEEITDLVVDDSCGAVSLFVGTTRDNFEGKKVLRLEYEAYEPMALKAMKSICEEIREKWPAVHGIAIYHRLGNVPCREASVIIAISSPHRSDSLQAVSQCIDRLKGSVPIWKKEVYATQDGVWKENAECSPEKKIKREPIEETPIDEDQVQINVSNEELQQRIHNFMDRKREQVNMNNIHDFIPFRGSETEEETCARVRAQYVRRNYSKGHLTVRKVNNEWGPQTIRTPVVHHDPVDSGLPSSIAERVLDIERFLNIGPVSKDVYKRLKDMEDRIAYLQAISPEYAQFWRNQNQDVKKEKLEDYTFSADDIARKIEQLEKNTTNL